MISTHELMINNFYGFKNYRDYPRVIKTNPINISSLSEFPQDYRELEITEDFLLHSKKFFSLTGYFTSPSNKIEVDVSLNDRGEKEFNVYVKDIFIGSIEYIHQLQNIYRVIEGEELVTDTDWY